MKAFKDGSRKDPTMNAMAAPLSDADIANISAFYAGLK
jgi:cytochrome c553